MRGTKLQPGQVLAGRYRIERLIGKGGMSSVFLAADLKVMGKMWAVKESQRHLERPDLFVREAEAMAGLEHPFLPKISDFYGPDDEGFSYIVMEYIRGESLQSRFDRTKRMEWREAVRYAAELCELFVYLHRQQPHPIIYRDLKPANIMIDLSGHVRLIDFGIARKQTGDGRADTIRLGTAGFAAPEQYRSDGQTDARTDLYTLGALLYYLLSGGLYYRESLEPIGVHSPGLPERLQEMIGRLLASSQDDRPSSADELLGTLNSLLAEPAPSAVSSSVRGAASRKIIVVGGVYAGAGSTFVTVSLARALHRFGIPATVVECGCNEPEHYALFYRGEIRSEKPEPAAYCWMDGNTFWQALSPDGRDGQSWNTEEAFRCVLRAETETVLLDISNHWGDPVVRELLRMSSHILSVCGPSASRIAAPPAMERWRLLHEWEEAGKSVLHVVNRDCRFAGDAEWRRLLGKEASARLPDLPSPPLRAAEWSGTPAADRSDLWELLQPEVIRLLEVIFPEHSFVRKSPNRRWFAKKSKSPLA